MDYNFKDIEKKWRAKWAAEKTYHVNEDANKEKYYVLNMFPYPSGAGLHVGHPLGYIASDIYARYKRLKGFNVLNPMGYDAYGLPAEQYAIQTGQHPAKTTEVNIKRYREQLDKIGFSFDWDREVRTCDPNYYHWTQWAFEKMFGSFYCTKCQKAQPIDKLVARFEEKGTEGLHAACSEERAFTADEWKAMTEAEKEEVLMNYRLAYLGETMVNWCPKLGTVLANDEVVDGVSERGGYPVVQKRMKQWCLRVSAYAQRLLDGLEAIDEEIAVLDGGFGPFVEFEVATQGLPGFDCAADRLVVGGIDLDDGLIGIEVIALDGSGHVRADFLGKFDAVDREVLAVRDVHVALVGKARDLDKDRGFVADDRDVLEAIEDERVARRNDGSVDVDDALGQFDEARFPFVGVLLGEIDESDTLCGASLQTALLDREPDDNA